MAGLESGSKSASEIELLVDVPAFNRGALPFDTDSDPDSDAEGSLTSPGVQDKAWSSLVGAVDYFEVE